ncbi:hypothetical protein [Acidianus two-tailed virus 2]|nr:hypothetical protein [Acidianus two-tailed virus 2]
MAMQPWEYVYKLLMPAEMPPDWQQKFTKYIYLALAVPLTKEFEEKIEKGDIKNLELPVYPVAFDVRFDRDAWVRETDILDILTRSGLYDKDYDFVTPINYNPRSLRYLDFDDSIPGYFPLAVLKLHFKRDITANPEDYGLKPIDGRKWELDRDGSYKVTAGLLFNVKEAKNSGHYSFLFLDDNPRKFNMLNGFGIVRFYISLWEAPEEVYAKTKEECESAGGVYYYDYPVAYCVLPLNKKEANIKASDFILQLNEMVKSKITSEDFLKHVMVYQLPDDMVHQFPGSEQIPVKPVIGKTFEDMVKVAAKDLILGGEEKESKQESQEQLFNPFTIDEMLTEEQEQQEEEENNETEEEGDTVKLG